MKIKKIGILAGLGFVISVPFGSKLWAQEVQNLNEIVVSATKTDQKKGQSGKVITVIDKAQLELNRGKNLAELLNHQAGINVVGAGNNFAKEKGVFLRGAAGSYTVILIDGIIANDPSGVGGAFDLRLFNLDQVERIEIIKGGQSVLYGSEAVAGIINIITKKESQKPIQGSLILGAGSYQTLKTDLGLRGAKGKFAYQINYGVLNTDGISEAEVAQGDDPKNYDHDGTNLQVLNANVSLQLHSNLLLKPYLKWNKAKFDYDADAFTDAPFTASSDHVNSGIQAVYNLKSGKLILNYAFQNTERIYKGDFPGTFEGSLNFLDVYYKHRISNTLDVLIGYDQRITSVFYEVLNKPKAELYSAYTNVYLHDIGNFNLEAGLRLNKHSNFGEHASYSLTPSYSFNRNLKAFGTVSTAFRAPTLDMLFGRFGANLNLKPELSENYELGLQIQLWPDQWHMQVSSFKRNLDQAIIYGANGYINQDQQKDQGFEIESFLNYDKWSVNGYYAYVKGKQISGDKEQDFLIRRPHHSFGINASFKPNKRLTWSLNYKFTGNRKDADFRTWPAQTVDLKSYQLVDLYVQYKWLDKGLNLFFDVKNLTNTKYTEIFGFKTMGINIMTGLTYNF